MKSILLVSLTLLISSCATIHHEVATEKPTRMIASEDNSVIVIHGYHYNSDQKLTAEELNFIPEFLASEYGITGINFKTETSPNPNQAHFSFEINRPNALKIYDGAASRLRNFQTGTVRTPEQIAEHQRLATCMRENFTVANFLADFSASDQFNFRFPIPENVRHINLQTGVVSEKPRCELWRGSEFIFATE